MVRCCGKHIAAFYIVEVKVRTTNMRTCRILNNKNHSVRWMILFHLLFTVDVQCNLVQEACR